MSIRYKTLSHFWVNSFKVIGALMVTTTILCVAQEQNRPTEGATAPAENADPSAQKSAEDPLALIASAKKSLGEYRTLKAQIVELFEFGPRRFRAEGVYLQGVDNRLRLDLEVKIDKNSGRLLQVSEGDILWTVYEIGETPRITRRDVKQILAAAESANAVDLVAGDLGMGGLPALLTAIEATMDFGTPVTAEIEGREFQIIQGKWKEPILQQFQAQAQQLPEPSSTPRPLPEHVPDYVRVYLDKDTHFPYRIRYLKKSPNSGEKPRPLLTIDFRDIVVNSTIDPAEFRYSAPDGVNVVDLTNAYVERLKNPGGAMPGQAPTAPVPPNGSP